MSLADKITDDVIIAEAFALNNQSKELITYFQNLTKDDEFRWLLDLYNHKKSCLSKISESSPEYKSTYEKYKEIYRDDYSVLHYALLEYKLKLVKELFPFEPAVGQKR